MEYAIYQVRKDDPDGIMFMSSDRLKSRGKEIHAYDYDRVYYGSINGFTDAGEVLEELFEVFNTRHPAGFKGHSLSISDVVVLTVAGMNKAYFCDSWGWTEVPDFLEPETHRYGTVKLHVCPNHCNSLFATPAHVVQTWKVDALGNFVEEMSTDGTTHGPDNGNIWECLECGAEAETVECLQVEVHAGGVRGIVFIPVSPRGCVYWIRDGMTAIEYVPVVADDRGIPTVKLDGQVFYLSDLQKGE